MATVNPPFVGDRYPEFVPELSEVEVQCLRDAIRQALAEDLAFGPDITTMATVPPEAQTTARLVSREAGTVAGLASISEALDQAAGAVSQYGDTGAGSVVAGAGVDVGTRQHPGAAGSVSVQAATVELHRRDGDTVSPGTVVASITGATRTILTAERTLLNVVCHLSGIATETARWVARVEGTQARIRDSRKTLPGLRALQKYAVRAGGGVNHRIGLGDAALIKDNHVAAAGGVGPALAAVRRQYPDMPCEVEVDSLSQLDEMLAAKADLVLLDNFPLWQMQIAVQRRDAQHPATLLEASGGLWLDDARDVAATGVDFLAIGALTHSVRALDLGLDF